jgi:hypothetical protein
MDWNEAERRRLEALLEECDQQLLERYWVLFFGDTPVTIELAGFQRLDGRRLVVPGPPPPDWRIPAQDKAVYRRMISFDSKDWNTSDYMLPVVNLVFERDHLRSDGVWVYRLNP